MKASITLAFFLAPALLALGVTAQAKPAPVETQTVAMLSEDSTIDSGPSGAMLESNYFHAPQSPHASGRVFLCPLQLRVFDKTRLARACN